MSNSVMKAADAIGPCVTAATLVGSNTGVTVPGTWKSVEAVTPVIQILPKAGGVAGSTVIPVPMSPSAKLGPPGTLIDAPVPPR